MRPEGNGFMRLEGNGFMQVGYIIYYVKKAEKNYLGWWLFRVLKINLNGKGDRTKKLRKNGILRNADWP